MTVQVRIGKDDIFLILSRSSVETGLEKPGLEGFNWESCLGILTVFMN